MKTINFNAEITRSMEKTAHRKALIESGLYSVPTHKVHKNVKNYNRKVKYKKSFTDDI